MWEHVGGWNLHTSKRMHFIEDETGIWLVSGLDACIRQNVCTSLRSLVHGRPFRHRVLHTSKRMHFIEDWAGTTAPRILSTLAYVKTYALH